MLRKVHKYTKCSLVNHAWKPEIIKSMATRVDAFNKIRQVNIQFHFSIQLFYLNIYVDNDICNGIINLNNPAFLLQWYQIQDPTVVTEIDVNSISMAAEDFGDTECKCQKAYSVLPVAFNTQQHQGDLFLCTHMVQHTVMLSYIILSLVQLLSRFFLIHVVSQKLSRNINQDTTRDTAAISYAKNMSTSDI